MQVLAIVGARIRKRRRSLLGSADDGTRVVFASPAAVPAIVEPRSPRACDTLSESQLTTPESRGGGRSDDTRPGTSTTPCPPIPASRSMVAPNTSTEQLRTSRTQLARLRSSAGRLSDSIRMPSARRAWQSSRLSTLPSSSGHRRPGATITSKSFSSRTRRPDPAFRQRRVWALMISDAANTPWSWELTAGENKAYPQTDQFC